MGFRSYLVNLWRKIRVPREEIARLLNRSLTWVGLRHVRPDQRVFSADEIQTMLVEAMRHGGVEAAQNLKPLNAKLTSLENDARFLRLENELLETRLAVQALEFSSREARLDAIEQQYADLWAADGATRH